MAQDLTAIERRTSADDVFDYLYSQINALKLLPGTRISEVEIARQLGVSRQPVREAFIRLANRGLLLIKPQKATIVRGFSHEKIKRARFIRYSVECEVLRRACGRELGKFKSRLDRSIEMQRNAITDGDIDRFHNLDYEFHRLLCVVADCEFVFENIAYHKAQVDRLCILSLTEPATMDDLLQDHVQLVDGLFEQDEGAVLSVIKLHLSRLDDVVAGIRKSHAIYFED